MLVKTNNKYTTIEGSKPRKPPRDKGEDRTWCRSLKTDAGVFVQSGIIPSPTVSQQIERSQIEQCHHDGRGRDDARDGSRSVFGFDEVG